MKNLLSQAKKTGKTTPCSLHAHWIQHQKKFTLPPF